MVGHTKVWHNKVTTTSSLVPSLLSARLRNHSKWSSFRRCPKKVPEKGPKAGCVQKGLKSSDDENRDIKTPVITSTTPSGYTDVALLPRPRNLAGLYILFPLFKLDGSWWPSLT